MKILVTGTAGFIGSFVTIRLLARGDVVIGIDNHNDYYDPNLKEARIERFINNSSYTHLRIDLANSKAINAAFHAQGFENVQRSAFNAHHLAHTHYRLHQDGSLIDKEFMRNFQSKKKPG